MSQNSVFRKVSLDRLASPEQLDQLLHVTDSRGWLALAGIGACLCAALIWSVFGSVPEKVTGQGILLKSGGIFEVVPAAGGRVVDVAVSVGDSVAEGAVVVRLAQPEIADRLNQARAELAELETRRRTTASFGASDSALRGVYAGQQIEILRQTIASGEDQLRWMKDKIAAQEQLVAQGLLLRSTLISTRQEFESTQQRIRDARSQLTQLDERTLATANGARVTLRDLDAKIEDQHRNVAELEQELKRKSEVVAPYGGRILELMTEAGNVVASGQPLLTLDLTGRTVKELEVVIYVPSIHGKQIRSGMPIQIAPSTVRQEEYGLMVGKVTYVSDFPATTRGMQRVLKNEKLVETLARGDAPYEIHADLTVDPSTPSRYKWTSSKGPALRVQSGTLALGNITVSSRRPVEMVFPVLKHLGAQ